MSKKRRKAKNEDEERFMRADINRPVAIRKGLTGEKLEGFLDALDVAACIVKINGMVNCGGIECGYRRSSDPRCKECPQNDADYVTKLIMEIRTGGKNVDYSVLDQMDADNAHEFP